MNETLIIGYFSLSSSSDETEKTPNQEFRIKFSGKKRGPQQERKEKSFNKRNNKFLPPFYKNQNKFLKRYKSYQNYNNNLGDFYKKNRYKKVNINKNNNLIKQQNYSHINNECGKKNKVVPEKFIPLPKEEYTENRKSNGLIINKLERQILTDLYDSVENKDKFDIIYDHIIKIKNILTYDGVEQAMKFLENINPLELREKIINLSTYFFKQVVKEEVENAEYNNGKLVLRYIPPKFSNRSGECVAPFRGKLNSKESTKNNLGRNQGNFNKRNNFDENFTKKSKINLKKNI